MPSAIGNFFIKAIVSSLLHPMLGDGLAVITVEGCKTGKLYATPINVMKENGGFTVTSLRRRSWWRNLRGGRPAHLRVSGQQYPVRGEVMEGHAEVASALTTYFKQHPGYAKYFGVRLAADGQPVREDVERAADERVVIHLCPAQTAG